MRALLLLLLFPLSLLAQPMRFAPFMSGSEDAAPPDFTTGLIRHYDATTITANDGDAIEVWTDLIGTTNLTQVTEAHRPLYRASDSGFGGRPSLWFGADGSLTNDVYVDASYTIFVVAYRTNTASGELYRFTTTSARITTGLSERWQYDSPTTTNTSGSTLSSGVAIVRFTAINSADTRSQDGAWANLDPNNQYDDPANTVFVNIGPYGSTDLLGYVGEIRIYDSPLSDGDVNLVGRYLGAKWNFTWTDL